MSKFDGGQYRPDRQGGRGSPGPQRRLGRLGRLGRPGEPGESSEPGRRALVLGAGGVLGAAWTIGALRALEDAEGWDPRNADMLLGTSAGGVLAALLAAGIGTETLMNHQRGVVVPGDPKIEYDHDTAVGGAIPPPPRPRVGSRRLLRRSLRRIHRNPLPAFYASLPEGRGSLDTLGELVDAAYPDGNWPAATRLWIAAMDYDTGQRMVFGSDGAPGVPVRDAVLASCAVPAWYAPVHIAGHRYIDGGMYSAASLDLLAEQGYDEVVMFAPMAAFRYDRPRSPVRWAERGWRRFVTRRMVREAEQVRRSGTPVTMLAPGPDDLAVIGANLMDPARRTEVLETSLRSTAEVLRHDASCPLAPAG